MRLRIESIDLIGSARKVRFQPGLNILTGPITTGKTTLLGLCRALVTTSLDKGEFPREVRDNVTAVAGNVVIGETTYSIVRPLVTTLTAKVDIASDTQSWRLPASRPDETSEVTYNQWLLTHLELPQLRVPSAPSEPTSEPTPVTVNDYFRYCRLTQDEIDSDVFASSDRIRDIKRRYVFEILYGIYRPETAALQEDLRNVMARIRQYRTQTDAFQSFLTGTPWENRAALTRDLAIAHQQLQVLETNSRGMSDVAKDVGGVRIQQSLIRRLDQEIADSQTALERERRNVEQLGLLQNQLQKQVSLLTRTIVADQFLSDLDFAVCPKCGTPVAQDRNGAEHCVLCLQTPRSKPIDRQDLIKEQDRIGQQIQETKELIEFRLDSARSLEAEIERVESQRSAASRELNFLTSTFVSDRADIIAGLASERAQMQSQIERLYEYLSLFDKLDDALGDIAKLESERESIEALLELASGRSSFSEQRIGYLEAEFSDLVTEFRLPKLEGPDLSTIDRTRYLPVVFGRRFTELSSQGLKVLVNVAHALAHHQTSLDLNLGLPQVLLIDGLTSNLGHDGEDLDRINSVYRYLIELSKDRGSDLQIIVADNDVPSFAEEFVRLRLDENERLII